MSGAGFLKNACNLPIRRVAFRLPRLAERFGGSEIYHSSFVWITGIAMKEGIHPKYNEVTVHCSCGTEFTTRSTATKLHVDICSQCHPFFTGTMKFIDSAGRVEKFSKKYNWKIKGANADKGADVKVEEASK